MKSARLHAERSQRLPNRRTAQHSGEVDPEPLDAERAEVHRIAKFHGGAPARVIRVGAGLGQL
jgi:hypothetical protein